MRSDGNDILVQVINAHRYPGHGEVKVELNRPEPFQNPLKFARKFYPRLNPFFGQQVRATDLFIYFEMNFLQSGT